MNELMREVGRALSRNSLFYLKNNCLHMQDHFNPGMAVCGDRVPSGTKPCPPGSLPGGRYGSCGICRGRQVVRKQRMISRIAWRPDEDLDQAARETIMLEKPR